MLQQQRRIAATALRAAHHRRYALIRNPSHARCTSAMPSAGLTDAVRAPPGALRCQKDSALRSLATRVLACELVVVGATKKTPAERFYEVELYDTVLFPEGGGQPWDTGKINDAVVDKVYVKDGRCIHRVPLVSSGDGGSAATAAGADGSDTTAVPAFEREQEVVASVDWDRRFDHMQQHSAQHLFSAIAEKYGYDTTSWWLGEERCNVELVHLSDSDAAKRGHRVISRELLLQIQQDVNAAILQALPMTPIFATPGSSEWEEIATKFSADQMPEAMRIVSIQGIENNPCCGVHVQNLSQLQSVRILNAEAAGAGATRVWFVAGNRVNREFSRMFEREQALTKLLVSAPDQHADRTEKLLRSHKAALKEVKALQSKLAASIAMDLLAQSRHQQESVPVVTYHSSDGGDLAFLQMIFKQLGDAKARAVFVLAAAGGDTGGDGAFVLAGPVDFIQAHSRDAAQQALGGKGGGGKNGVFQGKAPQLTEAKLQRLKAKLEELLRA